MTRSNPQARPPQEAALSAAFSRAVDLSALKRPTTPTPPPTADPSPYVIDVDEATFGIDVVERSMNVLVLVDLWAEWCQPCKQLSPLLERLVAEYQGAVILAKVDVDANPRISQAFGVQSIPTVVAVAGGQPVDAFTGAQPEPQVRAWIQGLIDTLRERLPGVAAAGTGAEAIPEPEPDPLVLAAENALEQGDFEAAIVAYEKLLALEPANSEVTSALAQLRFQQHAFELPADALERAAALPDDVPAQLDAADLLFATGQVEKSMEYMIDVVTRLTGADRDAARDHLLELFALLGHDDPVVIKYRRRLAAALY